MERPANASMFIRATRNSPRVIGCASHRKAVAKAAADGRKVIGGSRKFASRAEAKAAKIAAAKAKREAKAAAEKAGR